MLENMHMIEGTREMRSQTRPRQSLLASLLVVILSRSPSLVTCQSPSLMCELLVYFWLGRTFLLPLTLYLLHSHFHSGMPQMGSSSVSVHHFFSCGGLSSSLWRCAPLNRRRRRKWQIGGRNLQAIPVGNFTCPACTCGIKSKMDHLR